MKQLLYILFAVTLFTACSSDDDNDDNNDLSGTWNQTSISIRSLETADSETKTSIEKYINDRKMDKYVFSSNNFKYYENGALDWSGTFSISSGKITFKDDDYSESFDFTQNENVIYLENDETDFFKLIYKDKVTKVVTLSVYLKE